MSVTVREVLIRSPLARCSRIALRNRPGETPVASRKVRAKWNWLRNATSAMSAREIGWSYRSCRYATTRLTASFNAPPAVAVLSTAALATCPAALQKFTGSGFFVLARLPRGVMRDVAAPELGNVEEGPGRRRPHDDCVSSLNSR